MPRIDLITEMESIRIGDEDGWFLIRRLSRQVAREIRDRHTTRIESETAGGPSREEIDWPAVELDQLDWIVQDWLVYGPGGEKAPCTRQNKSALPAVIRDEILAAAGTVNLEGGSGGPLRP